MSRIANGIFGLLAATAAFGVIQVASGSDVVSNTSQPSIHSPVEMVVNRSAKGDRAAVRRVPVPVETARNNPAPMPSRPAIRRQSTLACEPVVSVLTSIAKQLPAGRCVT
jgi:hypothetical protein